MEKSLLFNVVHNLCFRDDLHIQNFPNVNLSVSNIDLWFEFVGQTVTEMYIGYVLFKKVPRFIKEKVLVH